MWQMCETNESYSNPSSFVLLLFLAEYRYQYIFLHFNHPS